MAPPPTPSLPPGRGRRGPPPPPPDSRTSSTFSLSRCPSSFMRSPVARWRCDALDVSSEASPVRSVPCPQTGQGCPIESRLMQETSAAQAAQLPVVIIGAGLAGLTVALNLAETQPVIVLAKRQLEEAATAWAQGGIVGVLGSDDSIESHVRDTQEAGAGLVDERTAEFIARHSAEAVE